MARHDPTALARRLRQLRAERWPEKRVTQQHVAGALGVALSSVSSWENPKSAKIPPASRLADYAVFFATPRSLERAEPRLLMAEELTDQERSERDQLAAELEQLRAAAVGEASEETASRPRSLWHFPDGGPVTLICGALKNRPPSASAKNHNYMQLTAYADVDALVELFGHVRAQNPQADVGFELADRLESDDLRTHLVMLGGTGLNAATWRTANLVDLPVKQVPDPTITDGEVFQLVDDTSTLFRPKFIGNNPKGEVTEDVGLFFRTPNPFNSARTLTLCSGVFTRGVYGAVRLLTDIEFRDHNHAELAKLFGDSSTFGLLMRVPTLEHATSTPDLRNPASVLYSWSKAL